MEKSDLQIRILEKSEIKCHDVLRVIGDYVDNELMTSLRGRVDSHINECGSCQELKWQYREVIETARELRNRPVPTDVKARLRNNLNAKLGLNLSF